MQDKILYQCSLSRWQKTTSNICHLLLYSKMIIISQKTPSQVKEQMFDITSLDVKIAWEQSNNMLEGFQIQYLSKKTGQIKLLAFKGKVEDLENFKRVLDGRAFYNLFSKQYQIINTILIRKDSQISKCLNLHNGTIKIVKKLCFPKCQKRIPYEVQLAMKLKQQPHKYILSIDEVYLEEDGIYLIMDNCEGGTLFQYFVSQNYDISIIETLKIMRKILKAVHHMHDNEIMHRDIKFDNILLRYNENIKSLKIIDLGLAIDINKKMLTQCGTPGYIAPEILNGKPYNQLCDIYSLGCLFHSLLSGERLFPQQIDKQHLYELNRQNCYKISRKIQDYHAKDLLLKMLNPEAKRPSALECLNHPFFQRRIESIHSISNKIKSMDFPLMKNPFNRKPITV